MSLSVLKFGGSSVGNPEKIRHVAKIIAEQKKHFSKIVVVVSAMGDTTDELIELAKAVSPRATHSSNRRELDMLLSSGERVSMALTSLALRELGLEAVSFTGSQSGIITDTTHGEARISDVRPFRVVENLDKNRIVIVAGFQGVSAEKEVTTLGRGGSDTSALALASALRADETVIYTDVAGFFSADPRIVKNARALKTLGWDLAFEAASRGAQVLHARCVELAWKQKMPLWVKSTFAPHEPGTLIKGEDMKEAFEGPRLISVVLQKNLVAFEAKRPQGLMAELASQSVRPLCWRQTQAKGATFFISEGQRDLVTDETKGQYDLHTRPEMYARVSLMGIGLESAPEIYTKAMELCALTKLEPVEVEIQPCCLSFVTHSKAPLEAFLNKVHDEFKLAATSS